MMVQVPDVLSAAQLGECRAMLERAEWVDGSATAGFQSTRVKDNLQLAEGTEASQRLGVMILDALDRSLLFASAALPARVFPPLFNCYRSGQAFGKHVDNAIRQVRGTGHRIRTDISATLFLNDPGEYDGGELVVDDSYGTHSVKLPAGHLVLYPSTSLHHVRPITRGKRLASFFWIQSLIREDAQRALLFDMDMAIVRLRQQLSDSEEVVALTGIYHNLLRRWSSL